MKPIWSVFGICSILIVAACFWLTEAKDWFAYKTEHGKSYQDQIEDSLRRAIFTRNKQRVKQYNRNANSSFVMGLNHLSDWTADELKQLTISELPKDWIEARNTHQAEKFLAALLMNQSVSLPKEVDWRLTPGKVSAVQDQGKCGSGWAFSTTGMLEGQQLKLTKAKDLVKLSEQNLIDCVVKSRDGCRGAWPADAMYTVWEEGGINSEQTYPYEAKDNNSCRYDAKKSIMTTIGPVVLQRSENMLQQMVANYGPVSIVFNVIDEFHHYSRGVFNPDDCSDDFYKAKELHAVLIVGYGTDAKDGDYWLMKNSWGSTWGESGYFRMARGVNMCGLVNVPVIAALPV